MQRVVIDTNTWVSGLIWAGAPRNVVQQVLTQRLRCFSAAPLVEEFQRVLAYPRIRKALSERGLTAADIGTQFALLCEVVPVQALPAPVCRDPDDDVVLACAVAAKADFIVTGDADLLTLGQYEGIRILTAAHALAHLGERRTN